MLINIYVRACLGQLWNMQVLSRGFLLYLCSSQKKKPLISQSIT